MKKIILALLIMILITPKTAFAYIDPGTASALISLIIGFFVAIGVVIRKYWYKAKKFFTKKKKD